MKTIQLIFLVIFGFNLNAQSYVILYDHTVNNPVLTIESQYTLMHKNNKSVYFKINESVIAKTDNEVITAKKQKPFYLKDYKLNTLINNQPFINSIKLIKEDLPLQKWKLHDEIKKIGSYTCKKATTSFRGRNYTAWYTDEIPILGGPWKFDGLPGLILEVVSDDGILEINALNIQARNGDIDFPVFDFQKEELLSWNEYKKQYVAAYNRIQKSLRADSEPDVEYSMEVFTIEDVGL